jgi:hypothetical protein
MGLYFEILKLTYKLDENANFESITDLKEYHFDWLMNDFNYESSQM